MRIISRYVLREFLRIFALTVLSFVLVFLVVDFLEKIDNFMEAHVALIRVAYYFLMLIPNVVFHMAPVAVLVSTLISLGLLARNNEIVAFKASGVSLFRLSVPIALAGMLLSVFMFLLADTVIPYTAARTNAIWTVEVEKKKDAASPIRDNVWFKKGKVIYHFAKYNERLQTLSGVGVYRLNDAFQLAERLEAKTARRLNGHWEFSDGLIKKYHKDGQVSGIRFDLETVELPELPQRFAQTQRSAEEMSLVELSAWIRQMEAEGYDALRYDVDFQLKFSFPFICAIMALIGLPLAFWKEKGGGIALGIGAGVGLSFIYVVFLGLSRSLGYSGLLPPVAAAWLPNMVFTLLSLFLFTHVRQ
ncbi:MAG: LPS export ABC transporter permease LptG [Proteobacteria bacterium]|nr:LPS export ABC transporter permease LptG [Pseudomonadota bacterium]